MDTERDFDLAPLAAHIGFVRGGPYNGQRLASLGEMLRVDELSMIPYLGASMRTPKPRLGAYTWNDTESAWDWRGWDDGKP